MPKNKAKKATTAVKVPRLKKHKARYPGKIGGKKVK